MRIVESSTAAGIRRTYRGSHVKFPLSSLQLARKHSRNSYITLFVCRTITWTWLVLGSGFGQKVAGSGRSLLGKGGESGFTVEILPVFPIHYSSFSDYVCHSSCKYSSSAPSTLSLVSYPFIFSPFLYSLSFFSCCLQKFTRKFHFSITLLMFSLYTHSLCLSVFHAPASPICLTVEK